MNDPLVQLGHRIDWDGLEAKIAPRFSEEGRPAVPAGFMPGMPILKSVETLSDDALFTRRSRDPYDQDFTRWSAVGRSRPGSWTTPAFPRRASTRSAWRGGAAARQPLVGPPAARDIRPGAPFRAIQADVVPIRQRRIRVLKP